jgi:hypothetical protein
MGAFYFSLDTRLAAVLAQSLGLEVFVETGTFEGDTLEAMGSIFPERHSIELSPTLCARARERFEGKVGVHLYQGESPECLAEVRKALGERPALYWLDAHWCAGQDTAGEKSQCPLLQELRQLNPLRENDVVLIDDARLFLCPPPHPHEVSDWPALQEVLEAFLQIRRGHRLMVVDDVMVIYPEKCRALVDDHAHKNGVDLLALKHTASLAEHWEQKHNEAKKSADFLQQEFGALQRYTKGLEAQLSLLHPVMRIAARLCPRKEKPSSHAADSGRHPS